MVFVSLELISFRIFFLFRAYKEIINLYENGIFARFDDASCLSNF